MGQRFGQAGFRLLVTEENGCSCASSVEKNLPIDNEARTSAYGMAVTPRSPTARYCAPTCIAYWTLACITATDRNCFTVSEQLKVDFVNRHHYYAVQSAKTAMRSHGYAPPVPETLKWHCENRRLG